MGAPDRLVRKLRLAARSEDDVRRMLPKFEDALRCASLPDQGAHVLVVRRLDLGRLSPDISAGALAQRVEAAMAHAGLQWVAGDTPEAAQADYVAFPSALAARMQLALRLAAARECAAWYWPLAVTEYQPALGAAENLRRIASRIAQWEEARVALPAWLAAIVAAGRGATLVAAIGAAFGEALVARAGLSMASDAASAGAARAAQQAASLSAEHEVAMPGLARLPAWLRAALVVAWRDAGVVPRAMASHRGAPGEGTNADTSTDAPAQDEHARAAPRGSALQDEAADEMPQAYVVPAPVQSVGAAHEVAAPPLAVEALADCDVRHNEPPHAARTESPHTAAASPASAEEEVSAAVQSGSPALAETQRGGLLFLLPVLARLGLPAWCEAQGMESHVFARRILRAVLLRLATPPDDPAFALAPELADHACGMPGSAPQSWRDARLESPRGRARYVLAEALAAAMSADAQARVWLDAARRLLRREAGIGLASLVVRPARVALSPTHCDMHFLMQDTDLRVRRAGLDADPGWLPWFARVVHYHYRERLA